MKENFEGDITFETHYSSSCHNIQKEHIANTKHDTDCTINTYSHNNIHDHDVFDFLV